MGRAAIKMQSDAWSQLSFKKISKYIYDNMKTKQSRSQ